LQAAAAHPALDAEAMNSLIEIYWQPSYHYVRLRFQRSHEEAEDLAQGFFTALLQQDLLARYDKALGPFRSYLRACLDHFVLKSLRDQTREKRGGGKVVPLDADYPASDSATPEEIFYREWQRQMFGLAIEDLQHLCDESDRQVRFRIFAEYDLAEAQRPDYNLLAQTHSLPVTTITNHLAWARRELRRLLEQRIASVTPDENERRREVRMLLRGQSA
jgi:RNA polymerase sigma factor (sigma-70 family)